jgi:hypothetical protein
MGTKKTNETSGLITVRPYVVSGARTGAILEVSFVIKWVSMVPIMPRITLLPSLVDDLGTQYGSLLICQLSFVNWVSLSPIGLTRVLRIVEAEAEANAGRGKCRAES